MGYEGSEFSNELKKYISKLDAYTTDELLRSYTDRTVKYLKQLFKEKCKIIGPVEYEDVDIDNLYEVYCIKCCYPITKFIFQEHLPKFKSIFLDIIDNELLTEEIEIMWYGHNSGHWFSFIMHSTEKLKTSPLLEKMKDDLAESIVVEPALEDDEKELFRAVAERNRCVTLPIYIQERCVLEGLKLPSFSLAYKMTEAFALLFNNDYGNIYESTGHNYDLSIIEGAIIPYIKFIGCNVCGRQPGDETHIIESEDEIEFYEKNKNILIKILDTSFYNYYLYRYNALTGYRKNNYLETVKFLFSETLQDLGPQIEGFNLIDDRELIITTFAENADCYTHIYAVFLMGLQGKELRIRDELATVFPLM